MGIRLNGIFILSIGLYSGIADKIIRIDSRFSTIGIFSSGLWPTQYVLS